MSLILCQNSLHLEELWFSIFGLSICGSEVRWFWDDCLVRCGWAYYFILFLVHIFEMREIKIELLLHLTSGRDVRHVFRLLC